MSSSALQKVEQLIEDLSPEETLQLIEVLAKKAQGKLAKPKTHRSLKGYYVGKLPADMDLDAELKKIRTQWQENLLADVME